MKKFYVLLIVLFISYSSYSQNCTIVPSVFNNSCDTICNSTIFINATPAGPYHIFLNGIYVMTFTGATTIGNLCPGLYDLYVTDSISCNYWDSLFIFQSPPLNIAFSVQDPSCLGCNDGSILTTVTGGVPPYSYIWSQGSTAQDISNLGVGIYCLTVVDQMQCAETYCDAVGTGSGFSLVTGNVYFDVDTNGIKNTLEPGVNGFQIVANPGGYTAFTTVDGTYYISIPNGNYTISAMLPGGWTQTSSPANYTVTLNDTIVYNGDFGVLPDTGFTSAAVYLTAGIPRCNWSSSYTISYKNNGFLMDEGEIIFNMPSQVSFISSTPPPDNISGNIYTWDFDTLLPLQSNNIQIIVQMPPTAGTILNSSALVNLHDSLSNIIYSDTVYLTQTVTCSYDPNDKLALPEGIGSQNAVPLNSELDFTIRFQNTGTDTAFVVVIKDTLDTNLDLSTFEIIASSHEMYAQMDPGGILTFTFDNILLPDSNVNEPASHGFVRYRIQPIQPVTDPTVITNIAYIFFDQNPAVVTNTTLTTLSDNLLSVAEINGSGIIKAYPNPFSKEILIQFEKNLDAELTLYDFSGKVVREAEIKNSASFVIKKEDLKAGIYLLKLSTNEGSAIIKLIIN